MHLQFSKLISFWSSDILTGSQTGLEDDLRVARFWSSDILTGSQTRSSAATSTMVFWSSDILTGSQTNFVIGSRGTGFWSSDILTGSQTGSQYITLATLGNVKFVEAKTEGQPETLMETMTVGRVYAVVKEGNIASIVYFDMDGRRSKQIDLSHKHDGSSPHTHHGYFHNEGDSSKGASRLTNEESAMVDRVLRAWENR